MNEASNIETADYVVQYWHDDNGEREAKIVFKFDDLGVQITIFALAEVVAQRTYDKYEELENKRRYNVDDPKGYDDAPMFYFVTPESGFYETYFGMLAATPCENCFNELNTNLIA